jgi:hypothetical protein
MKINLILAAGIVIAVTASCENNRSNSTVPGGNDYNHGSGMSTGPSNPTNTTASTSSRSGKTYRYHTTGSTATTTETKSYTTASGTDSDATMRMDSGTKTGKKSESEKLNNKKKGTKGSTGSGGSGATTGSTTSDDSNTD